MQLSNRGIGIALLTVLAAAGCGDDPAEPESTARMMAQVDGQAWEANYQTQLAVADYYPAEGKLDIVGLERDQDGPALRQISIEIDAYSGPGTYEVGGEASPAWAYYVYTPNETQPGVSDAYFTDGQHTGAVTIESFDAETSWVTGTFEFTAVTDTTGVEVEVTQGEFAGRYVDY